MQQMLASATSLFVTIASKQPSVVEHSAPADSIIIRTTGTQKSCLVLKLLMKQGAQTSNSSNKECTREVEASAGQLVPSISVSI